MSLPFLTCPALFSRLPRQSSHRHTLFYPSYGKATMDFTQNTLEITDSLKRLIRSKALQVVGKAGLTNADRPDVEQELWLDLLERWPKFRPNRARISTFIKRVLNHKVA